MAETTLLTASEKQKWISDYFKEYVRISGFKPYMGTSSQDIIVVKYELQNEAGKTINIPLITRLKNSGITGNGILQGNEEQLGNFNAPVTVDWRRNAVVVPKSTSFKTEMDLLSAARTMLKVWEGEKLRDDIISAMFSVEAGVAFSASAAAAKNAYLVANADRVLFGVVKSNNTGTMSTSLLNVDTAADKMTTSVAELAKRMAKTADPHIRPFKIEDGREFFVLFMGSRNFRDIKLDTNMINANRDARAREGKGMDDNPLFQDGDLLKDGIIYREIPEIDAFATASGFDGSGAAAADVRPSFLCGAQALAVAWGQEPTPRTDRLNDYEFRPGVAIEELVGVRKLFYASGSLGNLIVQHGMVSIFTAAAADS
jgi:N4-gp56 family major capsid protein